VLSRLNRPEADALRAELEARIIVLRDGGAVADAAVPAGGGWISDLRAGRDAPAQDVLVWLCIRWPWRSAQPCAAAAKLLPRLVRRGQGIDSTHVSKPVRNRYQLIFNPH
jgi:hypothetical protein